MEQPDLSTTSRTSALDGAKEDFPLFRSAGNEGLIYLDNAAITQVPRSVIDAVTEHLSSKNANVHRGNYRLSRDATDALEAVRKSTARFIGAASPDEIVFTSGTTDGLNQLVRGLEHAIGPRNAVLTTAMEHHSNLVPWQELCRRTGADLVVCPTDEQGRIDESVFADLLASNEVAVAAFTHTSNVTGCVNPVSRLAAQAHDAGALTVVDGAQAMRQNGIDMQALGCDFFAFSGHKMCAPTGIGVLWGRGDAFERLEPSRYGGGMVDQVTEAGASFSKAPYGFEGGTPNIAGIIGFGTAIEYLEAHDRNAIAQHESALTQRLCESLSALNGVTVLGEPDERHGAVSVVVERLHPYDIGCIMDKKNVAVRTGHHCAQPYIARLGADSALRFSPAFYNDEADIDAGIAAFAETIELLQRIGTRS